MNIVLESPLMLIKNNGKELRDSVPEEMKEIVDYNLVTGAIAVYCKPVSEADKKQRREKASLWVRYGEEILNELHRVSPHETFTQKYEAELIPVLNFYKKLAGMI